MLFEVSRKYFHQLHHHFFFLAAHYTDPFQQFSHHCWGLVVLNVTVIFKLFLNVLTDVGWTSGPDIVVGTQTQSEAKYSLIHGCQVV